MKNILVTGGAGFAGRGLIQKLMRKLYIKIDNFLKFLVAINYYDK
jgi:nucleoside-diphosphate-sugar epimerase